MGAGDEGQRKKHDTIICQVSPFLSLVFELFCMRKRRALLMLLYHFPFFANFFLPFLSLYVSLSLSLSPSLSLFNSFLCWIPFFFFLHERNGGDHYSRAFSIMWVFVREVDIELSTCTVLGNWIDGSVNLGSILRRREENARD